MTSPTFPRASLYLKGLHDHDLNNGHPRPPPPTQEPPRPSSEPPRPYQGLPTYHMASHLPHNLTHLPHVLQPSSWPPTFRWAYPTTHNTFNLPHGLSPFLTPLASTPPNSATISSHYTNKCSPSPTIFSPSATIHGHPPLPSPIRPCPARQFISLIPAMDSLYLFIKRARSHSLSLLFQLLSYQVPSRAFSHLILSLHTHS
jgi:hypothetical protein